MNAELYNQKNEVVGQVELPEGVFGVAWKPQLVHQALTAQMNNARRPWAHAKGRSEVRGGGKKPWRQKGTGRARHGSTRSPLWIGGGKAHGPISTRDYSQKINKKMRRIAFFSILSKRLKDKDLKFVDTVELADGKTKNFITSYQPLLNLSARRKKVDALIIPSAPLASLARAAKNLEKTKVLPATSLNAYDLLNYKHIIMDQKAVEVIAKRYEI